MRFFIVCLVGAALVTGGCKKKNSAAPKKDEPAAPAPEPVDPRNTAPVPGAGLQNVIKAGKRGAIDHDMGQLGTMIYAMELDASKMPSAAEIKESMKRDAPNLYKLIDEGVIVLTDTKNKAAMWAYEIDADKAGGIVLVAGVANRATAEQVKQYLANK